MEIASIDIFLRLFAAHLVADFILQPKQWVANKNKASFKAAGLYYHLLIVGVTSYLFLGIWNNWQIPVILVISHFIIDLIKINQQKQLTMWFVIDQFLHLLVILLCWLILTDQIKNVSHIIVTGSLTNQKLWLIAIGYLINTKPLAILIGHISVNFRKQIAEEDNESLNRAGEWIGMLERILVFTFCITNAIQVVGFLIAAKSIFRFGDLRETTDRKKTEYIFIGTLLSFTFAILIGLLINAVI